MSKILPLGVRNHIEKCSTKYCVDILGNAYLANFFHGGLEKREDRQNALRAYQQAEQHGEDWNPDLFYNRFVCRLWHC